MRKKKKTLAYKYAHFFILLSTVNSQLLSFVLSHRCPLKFHSRILSFFLFLFYPTKPNNIRCRSPSSTVFSLSKQKYYIRMYSNAKSTSREKENDESRYIVRAYWSLSSIRPPSSTYENSSCVLSLILMFARCRMK